MFMSNYVIKTLVCMLLFFSLVVFYPGGIIFAGIETVNQSLESGEAASEGKAVVDTTTSGVVMTDVLNIRSGAWGNIIGTFNEGDKVDVISKEGSWYKVKHNGGEAYVHSAYISTADSPAVGGDRYVNTPGSYLNVRSGEWGDIIGRFDHGAAIEVLGQQGEWYKVKYNNTEAFVHKDYISDTPVSTAAASSSGDPGAGFGGRPCDGGDVTSEFGPRDMFGNDYHYGIDLGVSTGTPLKSLGPGEVISTGYVYGGGNEIIIQYDNGYTSTYYHCLDATVSVGQRVSAGEEVGHTNNTGAWTTGPHLHFGIQDPNGDYVNPRDVPGIVI